MIKLTDPGWRWMGLQQVNLHARPLRLASASEQDTLQVRSPVVLNVPAPELAAYEASPKKEEARKVKSE